MSETQTLSPAADIVDATTFVPSAPPFADPWKKLRTPPTNPPGFWIQSKVPDGLTETTSHAKALRAKAGDHER